MSSLMIRMYGIEDNSAEEKLQSTITVPLEIFNIVAKHIPDQILRFVYDYEHPSKGSTAVNLYSIAQAVNQILKEIEAERRTGKLNGMIAEFVFPSENVEADIELAKAELKALKIVFSVEDSETSYLQ